MRVWSLPMRNRVRVRVRVGVRVRVRVRLEPQEIDDAVMRGLFLEV